MNLDVNLLSRKHLRNNIPHESQYLLKYFGTGLGKAFLFYYFQFKDLIEFRDYWFFIRNFKDHTGFVCSEQLMWIYYKKLKNIEKQVEEARYNFDFKRLDEILNKVDLEK